MALISDPPCSLSLRDVRRPEEGVHGKNTDTVSRKNTPQALHLFLPLAYLPACAARARAAWKQSSRQNRQDIMIIISSSSSSSSSSSIAAPLASRAPYQSISELSKHKNAVIPSGKGLCKQIKMRFATVLLAAATVASAKATGKGSKPVANEAHALAPSDDCIAVAFVDEKDGLARLANEEFHPSWGRCAAAAVSSTGKTPASLRPSVPPSFVPPTLSYLPPILTPQLMTPSPLPPTHTTDAARMVVPGQRDSPPIQAERCQVVVLVEQHSPCQL